MKNSNCGYLWMEKDNEVFSLSAISVIGDRDEQQDSLGSVIESDCGMVVICDGMGGHEGGKAASNEALETLVDYFSKRKDDEPWYQVLLNGAKEADKRIYCMTDDDGMPLRAGSTLSCVVVDKGKLSWCSVGDSRAYLMRGEELVCLTQDHNYRSVLVEKKNAGLISDEDYIKEDARGDALISFLGIGSLELIDYSVIPFELLKDDKIIIMSDGLYKTLTDEEIGRILDNFSNVSEAVRALEMKSENNSRNKCICRDNTTVAMIKIK